MRISPPMQPRRPCPPPKASYGSASSPGRAVLQSPHNSGLRDCLGLKTFAHHSRSHQVLKAAQKTCIAKTMIRTSPHGANIFFESNSGLWDPPRPDSPEPESRQPHGWWVGGVYSPPGLSAQPRDFNLSCRQRGMFRSTGPKIQQ